MSIAYQFDPIEHRYSTQEDGELKSVTHIIQAAGLVNYDMVPPLVLRRKAQLGRLVHQACHFYDEQDLPDQLHQEIAERLDSYKAFRVASGYVPTVHESQKIAEVDGMRYGMQFDSTGHVGSKPVLLDIKNAAQETPAWGVQLAAYEMGIGRPPLPHLHFTRMVAHLLPGGKFRVHTYADKADFDVWRACMAVVLRPVWVSEDRIEKSRQAIEACKRNKRIT